MYNFLDNFSEKDITNSLYGLFLGDGSYRDGWIKNKHTIKQNFYCKWLEDVFSSYGLKVSSRYNWKSKTTIGTYIYSNVNIKVPNKTLFENNNICFDSNGKKYVSSYVLDNINEFGLLLWFLDDGQWHVSFNNNKAKRFGYLNTQSFSLNENYNILNMFQNRFDINLKVHEDHSGFNKYQDRTYYRLYFNATNFRKFFDIVRPYLNYIPKDYYYKFDMKYMPNRIKNSIVFSEKYNLSA